MVERHDGDVPSTSEELLALPGVGEYTAAAVAAFFAWASWLMVKGSFWTPSGAFHMEGTGSAWNPPTPALLKGFLFIVMIILAVQFVVLAVNHARRARRGSKQDA